jgi:uncharacterized protein
MHLGDFLFLPWLAAILVPVVGTLISLRFLEKSNRSYEGALIPAPLPPISILKPLKGLDEGLEENLESFFLLDYPRFELIFCVADPEDPAAEIVKNLLVRYPAISARLFVGAENIRPNPKINNIARGYDSALHELILISDSNIRAHRRYLRELVHGFKSDTAIETSIITANPSTGLGGALEASYLNTLFARGMIVADVIGHPCVVGKSMLFKKETLEKIGGLQMLSAYIAEDYIAGERCRRAGLRITICPHPLEQFLGKYTFRHFWSRHLRWGRMRKNLAPLAFALEPISTNVGAAAIGATAYAMRFGTSPVRFLACHFAVWLLCDLGMMRRLGVKAGTSTIPAWLLAQLLHLPLWVHIACGNTVLWRGQRLRVKSDGTLGSAIEPSLWKRGQDFISSLPPRTARQLSCALLGVVLVLTGAQGYSLRSLNTHYSLRQFMPTNHPLYKADSEIRHEFELPDEQPVLITLQLNDQSSGTWLTPERVAALREATTELASVPGMRHITSLTNFETASDSAEGIQVGNFLALMPPSAWGKEVAKKVANDNLLTPALVSRDQRATMLLGDIGVLPTEQISTIVSSVRAILSRRFPDSGGIHALVGGVVPLQSDMTVLISKELTRFLLLGFLACVVTLIAYFRSFSTVLSCLLLAVISNIASLSCMALAGVPFSILSTTLPVLASITALAIGSHTFLNFGNAYAREAKRISNTEAVNKVQWVRHVYASLALPNFLMALTTAIGFATLGGSNVPMMRQFAWSVSGGIIAGWFSISLALPALMYLMPVPKPRNWTAADARWAFGVIRFRQVFFVGVLLVVGIVAFHGVRLNWSVQLFDDLPMGSVRTSTELIDRELGGMIPLDTMIRIRSESSPWNEPGRIAKLEDTLSRWRQDPTVGSGFGIPELLKAGKAFGSSATRQSVAETFFLLSLSEHNPVTQFLSTDGSATRLSFRLKDVPAEQMEKTVHSITADLQKTFPEAEITIGGMAPLVHKLNAELSRELISGLWQSLLLISILMVVVFRSIRWALVAAIPNLLAPLALIATMALLKTPIKPSVAVIFSIALGVAYNNTVYLMCRLKTLRVGLANPLACVRQAWYQEGNPCLFSSLALFGGFAVFLSSYFELNRTFGAYMLWSIGVGLFGDLIFLPVLLGLFPKLIFSIPSGSDL